jgi:hypothetical protein
MRMLLLLIVSLLCFSKALSQSLQNPAIWQAPRLYNVSDPADTGISVEQDSRIAMSQDFQTIRAGHDIESPMRVRYDTIR